MTKLIIPILLAVASSAGADTLRSATLTQAVNNVQVFPVAKPAYPAVRRPRSRPAGNRVPSSPFRTRR
jgi:hypothetical protein